MRVDHGTEFCLCIFVQELLKNRRHDNSRAPWRQTTSTKNYRAERLWPEENSRVNYPLKKALCIIKKQEIFNMEDPLVSFAVSWLTINVSKVGSENFVNSWNHHRIPGEWWYFISESHGLSSVSFTKTTSNHINTALLSTEAFGPNYVSNI